jgi:hypothetical protein
MKLPLLRSLVVLAAVLGTPACDPRSPCDPGYYVDHGACFPSPTHHADGGAVADAASLLDARVDPYAGFGSPCSQASDCTTAGAPICGAPQFPICTAIDCLGQPAVCPPTWTCLDVGQLSGDPTVKSACVQF